MFVIRWYSFIIGAMFFWLFQPFISASGSDIEETFFSVRMVGKIALKGLRSMLLTGQYKSFSIFKETIKNIEKDKVITLMVYKNVQTNKSLAK